MATTQEPEFRMRKDMWIRAIQGPGLSAAQLVGRQAPPERFAQASRLPSLDGIRMGISFWIL